ncbi:helix-turn-helix domain-containing protein [Naasia lichenicola]|nr:helix-turn-helix transcriptional regulator [Naasia lichenicola]
MPAPGLGDRIARYRRLNGWSAQQLSEQTDGAVSRSTIANVETGRREDLTVTQFISICMALRLPPSALLLDVEKPFENAGVSFPGDTPAPFGSEAPVAKVMRWIDGREPFAESPATERHSVISALVDDYQSDLDTLSGSNVRGRFLQGRDDEEVAAELAVVERRFQRTALLLRRHGVVVHERNWGDLKPAQAKATD